MGKRYSLWERSGFPGLLRATHRRRCVPFLFATGCSVKVGSSISVSFWLRMPGLGGAGSRSRNGMFCVPWAGRTRAVAPCLLCEELAVILVLGVGVALALTLARLLLRDFGPLVPRPLLLGLWWRCWSGVARSCSPGHITASVLVPGPWPWLPRLSPAIRLPPMGWLGWEVCVCLHFLKYCLSYFKNTKNLFIHIARIPIGDLLEISQHFKNVPSIRQ